jgi:hypothetical protein
MRDYYKVLLVGGSGKGKTYSFRDMDPKTTGFINVENKPLPFKVKFDYHARITSLLEAKQAIKDFAGNDDIKCIVFDSFSAYVDLLLADCRKTKRGFDIWSTYNEEIGKMLNFIKAINKEVIVTAHYEWVQDEGGAKERRVKVKGREWEGVVEKEFTLVLYADNKVVNNKPIYSFHTFLEDSSAKCPPGMFPEGSYTIDNNSHTVLNAILEFVK